MILDLSYPDMQRESRFNTCSCGAGLTVAWVGGNYVLRCSKDLTHNMLKRKERYPEYLRQEILKSMSTELAKITKPQMLQRIDSVKWPKDLTPAQREMLANIAMERGLDPMNGELMIYQGKPYVCIDGRRRKAQETGDLDGVHKRPGTKQEKEDRQLLPDDYLAYVEVWKKGSSHPFEAWGVVQQREIEKAIAQCQEHQTDPYSLPLVNNPQSHAEKRGESLALREAFHLPLPSAEDIPGGPEIVRKFDAESTARDLGDGEGVTTDMGSCPVHHKAFKLGRDGNSYYCPTKTEDGKWCKEKPQTKKEEGHGDSGEVVVGSDSWLFMMITKLKIPDATIIDEVLVARFGFDIKKVEIPLISNFKNLSSENRADFVKMLKAKEAQANKA